MIMGFNYVTPKHPVIHLGCYVQTRSTSGFERGVTPVTPFSDIHYIYE